MKIGLVGYGKMGKMIEQLAAGHGMEVAARFDIDCVLQDNDKIRKQLEDVPVLIEFTTPDTVIQNIKTGLALGKSMVIGTTGWQSQIHQVGQMVKDADAGLVHASNFSLGVNLFYEILDQAGKIMSRFENYDPFLEESHHKFKKDAPSGTALVIRDIIQTYYKSEIPPVACVRAGYIPGTHSVSFDSKVDTIRLEHVARNREGLAEGALIAAKWIATRKGMYGFREVMKEILQ